MKKKIFEVKYDFHFVHCDDPWDEFHNLVIYEDGNVLLEEFMDDRIPSTIKKTIKNDCPDYFIRDLKGIFENNKTALEENQGRTIESFGDGYFCDGYMKIGGYKKMMINTKNRFKSGNEYENPCEEWMKNFLDEITSVVNRYCFEQLSFSSQLGFGNKK